jgi:hypothetical protein
MTLKTTYSAPTLQVAGKLHRLTLTPGGSNGQANGKGSVCFDGVSSLQGNRSYNSGSCTQGS